jgi:hypothetical protein
MGEAQRGPSSFVLRHSFGIRHSSFVILDPIPNRIHLRKIDIAELLLTRLQLVF